MNEQIFDGQENLVASVTVPEVGRRSHLVPVRREGPKPLKKLPEPKIKITREEWDAAYREFPVINCGPTALAAVTGAPLLDVLRAIPKFKERGYTSPVMMKDALANLGVKYHERFQRGFERSTENDHILTEYGIIRIQFDGPWYGKFAYHYTHWVAAAMFDYGGQKLEWVFDVNNHYGWMTRQDWEYITMPELMPKRGNGKWFATHRWELDF